MSLAESFRMGEESQAFQRPSERLKGYLASRYRTAGPLAYDAGISAKQAENLLLGHWPNDLTFAAIVRRFGRDIWSAVFEPEIAPVLARLEGEERRLDRQLEEIRARKREVARVVDGGPDLFQEAEAEARSP